MVEKGGFWSGRRPAALNGAFWVAGVGKIKFYFWGSSTPQKSIINIKIKFK
jgi:hypothetical protein